MVAEGPAVASQVRAEPIHLNFWAGDGTRIKVEELWLECIQHLNVFEIREHISSERATSGCCQWTPLECVPTSRKQCFSG